VSMAEISFAIEEVEGRISLADPPGFLRVGSTTFGRGSV
jgi:hypothetical protein